MSHKKCRCSPDVDPELKQLWEDKLAEYGLGEIRKDPNEVPLDDPANPELMSETLRDMLEFFSCLPENMREDILNNIGQHRRSGETSESLYERAKTLINYAFEMLGSDNNRPQTPCCCQNEKGKLDKELDEHIQSKNFDEVIRYMEKLVSSKDTNHKAYEEDEED